MKRVLMITSAYPPQGGTGAQRMGALSYYLEEYGWQADVLTVEPSSSQPVDPELTSFVSGTSNIRRSKASRVSAFVVTHILNRLKSEVGNALKDFLFPLDGLDPWIFTAIPEAIRLHTEHRYDLLFSSFPTPAPVFIASYLRNRFDIPWVQDFRDPWLDNIHYQRNAEFKHNIQKRLEKKAIEESTAITATNKTFKQFLMQSRDLSGTKIFSIPHGYDSYPGNVLDQGKQTGSPARSSGDTFRMISSGSIYPSRSLDPVVETIAGLVESGDIPESKIVFEITGATWNRAEAWSRHHPWVKLSGFLPGISDLRKHLLRADLGVTVLSEGKNSILGRLQEYIGAGLPILLIALEDSAAADLVRTSGLGTVVSPGEPERLRSVLRSVYKRWGHGDPPEVNPNREWIRAMHRPNLVRKFARVFDAAVDGTVNSLTIDELI